jgi:hypothetical protein
MTMPDVITALTQELRLRAVAQPPLPPRWTPPMRNGVTPPPAPPTR